MSVYFSPNGGGAQALIDLIHTAKSTIDVAIYGFNNMDIAEALINAQNSGVKVRVIMDKMQTHGNQATLHDVLESTGMPIFVYHPPSGIMHNKFMIVDGMVVATGSYNYTTRAEQHNDENLVILANGGSVNEVWMVSFIQNYENTFASILGYAQLEVPKGFRRTLARFIRAQKALFPNDNTGE